MLSYENYVKTLGFEVVERLEPSGCPIFKASNGALLMTVKFGDFYDWFAYPHVQKENKVLDRVKGVEGIVEKISFHKFKNANDEVVALVRKYIEGKNLISESKLVYPDILVNAVNTLHEKGIADLDLTIRNVVVDPTGKPCIIDLGYCNFKENVGKRNFERTKNRDLMNLEWILNNYKND